MQTKLLIQKLQTLVDEHEASGALAQMGEHETMIDWFSSTESPGSFIYRGYNNVVNIELSDDGVYHILSAF